MGAALPLLLNIGEQGQPGTKLPWLNTCKEVDW